jgi:hypothetical protein
MFLRALSLAFSHDAGVQEGTTKPTEKEGKKNAIQVMNGAGAGLEQL